MSLKINRAVGTFFILFFYIISTFLIRHYPSNCIAIDALLDHTTPGGRIDSRLFPGGIVPT